MDTEYVGRTCCFLFSKPYKHKIISEKKYWLFSELWNKVKSFNICLLVWWQQMSNTATEVQVSLCKFCENKPVMDGSILAQQEFLEAGIELAVCLICNSATC